MAKNYEEEEKGVYNYTPYSDITSCVGELLSSSLILCGDTTDADVKQTEYKVTVEVAYVDHAHDVTTHLGALAYANDCGGNEGTEHHNGQANVSDGGQSYEVTDHMGVLDCDRDGDEY